VLTDLERAASPPGAEVALETATPRVSIIIPCYKTAQFVAETLQSVFAQTYKNFEVILVNDGSPDTPELEEAIAPWREKITYLHTENCGLAGARNNGIRAAKGELIALLDSDDMWEPNYLEVQVSKLDSDPTADIVYPRTLLFGDTATPSTRSARSTGEVTFSRLVQQQISVMVSVLARRNALERAGLFDDSLRSCEDFDMWLRCVKSGSRIIYHDDVLVRYRVRGDSLSADPVWMYDHARRVLEKMLASMSLTDEERSAVKSAIRRMEGNRLFHEGKRAFLAGDDQVAIARLKQADSYLNSFRIRIILFGVQKVPRTLRTIYEWGLHQKMPFAWAFRREVV
jgi:glycosyltransferase involved in cell wall biosynthesis